MTKISTQISLPELAFAHAANTAEMWLEDVESGPKSCAVTVSAERLNDANMREKLISWVGNTPGLADALATLFTDNSLSVDQENPLVIEVLRDDSTKPVVNNPLKNMELARKALSPK